MTRLLIAACLAALPTTAVAQMICGERDTVIATLADRYGEEVRGMGLAAQNRILEVFVSEETGTWTITLTSADGMTCLMAAGQHFSQMPVIPAGEDL